MKKLVKRIGVLIYALLAVIITAFTGCLNPADISSTKTTTFADGTHVEQKTKVRTPKYSKEGTYLVTTAEATDVFLGASQKVKDIEGAVGDAASKKIVYASLGLIMLLGAVALAMPNAMVSNKDALMIIGCGVIGFAIFRYVEASAKNMGFIIPLIAISSVAYLFWKWRKAKL